MSVKKVDIDGHVLAYLEMAQVTSIKMKQREPFIMLCKCKALTLSNEVAMEQLGHITESPFILVQRIYTHCFSNEPH